MRNEYEILGNITVIWLSPKASKYSLYATIDTADLDKVKSVKGTWTPVFNNGTKSYYAVTGVQLKNRRRFTTVSMHRIVFDTRISKGRVVDHINHETLDNRRSVNLRVVTRSENALNSKKKYLASLNTA